MKLHDLKHQGTADHDDDNDGDLAKQQKVRKNKMAQRMREMRRRKMEEQVIASNSYRFLQDKFNKLDESDIMWINFYLRLLLKHTRINGS